MKLQDLRKLHQKKYRDELGHFLVEGEHLVLELQRAALHDARLRACELYVTRARKDWGGPFVTHVVSDAQMARIAETRTPQGIIALVPIVQPRLAGPGERSIYLHEVQDPGNLGTILRTLAWFGKFRCLLSPASVDPYNSKVIRASAGAIFHVPVEVEVELTVLRERFARVACLGMQGEALSSPDFRTFSCYLFGNEARGLPLEALTALDAKSYSIPGGGSLESLNLASAVSMSVYELTRQG